MSLQGETQKKSKKLTTSEKSWILYDVGNSAFILIVSTILPIYFNYLGENGGLSSTEYLAYWGYAASLSTLAVAVMGPVLGTMADRKNLKKPIFVLMVLIGVIGCLLLGFMTSWLIFLAVYVVTKIGYSASLIFYDAMLPDVTDENRMDKVSSQGYAWGYIGSCIPFGIGLVFVLGADGIGISMEAAMGIALGIVAVWWIVMTLPLLRCYRQTHYVEPGPHAVRESFRRLGRTFRELAGNRRLLFFFIAYFFYIDGVYTIIEMATAYGTALGLDSTGLLMALLVTQIVAFPCSILFGKLTDRFRTETLITVCILAYTGIAVFALFMTTQLHFWILAVCVGMFQGGVQALSRSHFAKLIPPEKSGNYFGILDICGKGASFLGTFAVGLVTQISGNANLGVGILAVFFVVGLCLFRKSVHTN